MVYSDLIDHRTMAELQNEAPVVTMVPVDIAVSLVRAFDAFGAQHEPYTDLHDKKYWETDLKSVQAMGHLGELAPKQVGKICRVMGLMMWRCNDGFHVAWSSAQIAILKKYFHLD